MPRKARCGSHGRAAGPLRITRFGQVLADRYRLKQRAKFLEQKAAEKSAAFLLRGMA